MKIRTITGLLLALSLSTIFNSSASAFKVCKPDKTGSWDNCEEVVPRERGMKFTINNTGKKTIPVIIQGVERQVRGCSSRDFTVKTSKSSYKVTLYRDTVTVRDGDERDFWVGENPNVLSVGRYGAITGERLQRGEPSPNNTDYSCY